MIKGVLQIVWLHVHIIKGASNVYIIYICNIYCLPVCYDLKKDMFWIYLGKPQNFKETVFLLNKLWSEWYFLYSVLKPHFFWAYFILLQTSILVYMYVRRFLTGSIIYSQEGLISTRNYSILNRNPEKVTINSVIKVKIIAMFPFSVLLGIFLYT